MLPTRGSRAAELVTVSANVSDLRVIVLRTFFFHNLPGLDMMRTALLLFAIVNHVLADPASLSFNDCFSNPNASQKMTITNVYAQVLQDVQASMYLNLTVIGNNAAQILPSSNSTDLGACKPCADRCPHSPYQQRPYSLQPPS